MKSTRMSRKENVRLLDGFTRRQFLIGAGSLLMFAPYGCGGSDGNGSADSGELRTVDHEFGTAEVPVDPQRIVSVDPGPSVPTLGTLAALDVDVVAASVYDLPGYLESDTENTEILPYPPDLEALAAADPDLILTPGVGFNQDTYELLPDIAPTVAPDFYWKTLDQITGYWEEVAELVGRPEQGRQLATELDSQISEVRQGIAHRMEGKPVSVLQALNEQQLNLVYGRLESALLDAIGVSRPDNQVYEPDTEDWFTEISPETLGEADAWAMFVEIAGTNEQERDEYRRYVESQPLWNELEAVQNDRVFWVTTDEWAGTDPLSAPITLDLIDKNLTEALNAEEQS